MKIYIDNDQQQLRTLQPIVREDKIDLDIKKTEESLKEMNERFDKIKLSHSPLLSSRRTITPIREERPNTSNLIKARKFDRNFENQ